MESIIEINSDDLHDVVYEIKKGTDIEFPKERIKSYLVSSGFTFREFESSNGVLMFVRNGKRAVACSSAISIQELKPGEREKFHQVFNSYIISRSKIFFDSALQNQKASKINLIQNQKRTCVSNMYYSLHNCFAGYIENYREVTHDTDLISEIFKSEDEEGMLGHFTPQALNSFTTIFDELITMSLTDALNDERLRFGRYSSHQNPFTWILLLKEHINNEKLVPIVEEIQSIVNNANMSNYGADISQRRTNSEIQLKDSITQLMTKFNSDNQISKTLSILACFLGNSYILRQSGDYDSLFDVKVEQKDIIYWTIASSNLIDFIMEITGAKNKVNKNRIQRLDAVSSQNTLLDSLGGVTDMLMTQTGIIIDSSFDFMSYGKYLYQNKNYYPVNANGRYDYLSDERPYITLQKN